MDIALKNINEELLIVKKGSAYKSMDEKNGYIVKPIPFTVWIDPDALCAKEDYQRMKQSQEDALQNALTGLRLTDMVGEI